MVWWSTFIFLKKWQPVCIICNCCPINTRWPCLPRSAAGSDCMCWNEFHWTIAEERANNLAWTTSQSAVLLIKVMLFSFCSVCRRTGADCRLTLRPFGAFRDIRASGDYNIRRTSRDNRTVQWNITRLYVSWTRTYDSHLTLYCPPTFWSTIGFRHSAFGCIVEFSDLMSR